MNTFDRSAYMKARWADPAARQKMLAAQVQDREAIGEGQRRAWAAMPLATRAERMQKLRTQNVGRKDSPETIAKKREAALRRIANESPAARNRRLKKFRAMQRARWADPMARQIAAEQMALRQAARQRTKGGAK